MRAMIKAVAVALAFSAGAAVTGGEAEAQGGQVGFTTRRPSGFTVGQLARTRVLTPRRARPVRRGAIGCTAAGQRGYAVRGFQALPPSPC